MTRRCKPWLTAAAVLGGLSCLILWLAGSNAAWSETLRHLSPYLTGLLSWLLGWLPTPLGEWLAVLVPLAVIGCLIAAAVRHHLAPTLSRLLALCALLAFLFVGVLGVHYTAPPLADRLGLTVEQYSAQQLAQVLAAQVETLNALAQQVPRADSGACDFGEFSDIAEAAKTAADGLKARYPDAFTGQAVKPKATALISVPMSYLAVAGIFFPFTAEAMVNSNNTHTQFPFVAAHEAAHSMGVGPEAEANFAAWLACSTSEDVRLRYSAAFNAYLYAGNALYAQNRELWRQTTAALDALPRHDLQVLSDHQAKYETPVEQVGTAVNDAYIKATGQSDGVRSYGKMVDLLIAWHLAQ